MKKITLFLAWCLCAPGCSNTSPLISQPFSSHGGGGGGTNSLSISFANPTWAGSTTAVGKSSIVQFSVKGMNPGDKLTLAKDAQCASWIPPISATRNSDGTTSASFNFVQFSGFDYTVSFDLYANIALASGGKQCTATGLKYTTNLSAGTGFPIGNSEILFGTPTDVAIDSQGCIYVADAYSSYANIQKIAPPGACLPQGSAPTQNAHLLMTIPKAVGNAYTLSVPKHLAVDSSFNIYVADADTFGNGGVYKFDSSGNYITKSASGIFTLTNGAVQGIAVDTSGNVFVAQGASILVLTSNLQTKITAYNSATTPVSLAVDVNDMLYVLDVGIDGTANAPKIFRMPYNSTTKAFAAAVTIPTNFGSASGNIFNPSAIALDSNDVLYVSDAGNNRIQVFQNGAVSTSYGPFVYDPNVSQSSSLKGLAVNGNTNTLYVADSLNSQVLWTSSAAVAGSASNWAPIGPRGAAVGQLQNASAITIDSSNNIYVADGTRIQEFDANGVFINTLTGSPDGTPGGNYDPGSFFTPMITFKSVPTQVLPSGVVVLTTSALPQVAVGGSHFCAIRSKPGYSVDQTLLCWGSNLYGQLGDGTRNDHYYPVPVDLETKYAGIFAGDAHTCGLTTGGAVRCWGNNANGQVGKTGAAFYTTPQAIVGSVTTLAAGSSHTCAISGGSVSCWGLNSSGQLGNGGTSAATTPTAIGSTSGYTSIVAGGAFTCGLSSGIYCWGDNSQGQMAVALSTSIVTSPTQIIITGATISKIQAGGQHVCAVDSTNYVWCWGSNSQGQLGPGSGASQNPGQIANRITPTKVYNSSTTQTLSSIALGGNHSCGIDTSNIAYCWGYDNMGQLGFLAAQPGQTNYVSSSVSSLQFKQLFASGVLNSFVNPGSQTNPITWGRGDSTCGVTSSGVLYCWGLIYTQMNAIGGLAMPSPKAVVGQGAGNMLYVTDVGHASVQSRNMDTSGWFTSSYLIYMGMLNTSLPTGGGGYSYPYISNPLGVTYGVNNEVFYVDSNNNRVIATSNSQTTQPIQFDGSLPTSPTALTVDQFNYLYVVDTFNNRIGVTNPGYSSNAGCIGGGGCGYHMAFLNPTAISIDTNVNASVHTGFVTNSNGIGSTVSAFTVTGTGTWGASNISLNISPQPNGTAYMFNNPNGVAIDSSSNIYILDSVNGRVLKFDKNGNEVFY